jgi:hypothetical protein
LRITDDPAKIEGKTTIRTMKALNEEVEKTGDIG